MSARPTPPVVSGERIAALLDGELARPAYRSLAERIRLLAIDGRIPLGARLPSERDLVASLGVSRTTVTRAYAELRDTGYLASRRGAGSVITLPRGAARTGMGALLHPVEAHETTDLIDLTCAALRAPAGTAEAYQRALAELPHYLAGSGYVALGLPELRQALAERYSERGLATDPAQIIITSGAMSAITIALRSLATTGVRVAVESPSFPNTLASLRRGGYRLTGLPVDPTGWHIPTLAATVRSARPAAAVLIPDFHNPTGALMPDDDRAALGAALAEHEVGCVIDETLCEITVEDDLALPLPFAAHATDAVSVGSSSKSHWGGLRTGWIRAPRPEGTLREVLAENRIATDPGAAVLEQLVLLHLLRTRQLHDAHRRAELRQARDALAGAVRRLLPQASFVTPRGGLSLWVELAGVSTSAVADAARARGLLIAGGGRFAVQHGLDRWLRLPYVHPSDVLVTAVERLALTVDDVQTGRTARGAVAAGVTTPTLMA